MIFNIFGIESSTEESKVQAKVKSRLRLSRSYTDLVDLSGGSGGDSESQRGGGSDGRNGNSWWTRKSD
jgi:hypothetical protein